VADRVTAAKRRRWADVVLIVAGLYVFLAAIWAPPGLGPAEAMAEARYHGMWWWAHALGGSLALAAVLVAMKSVLLARVLAAAAVLVLLAGLLAFETIGWLAARTLLIPALLILAATPFIGPMPAPEEEGSARRSLGADRPPAGPPPAR
jgi:hypothetical protein